MKKCGNCKEIKEISEFNKKGDSLQSKCKKCNSLYLKEHYKLNHNYYLEKKNKRKIENRLFINSLKLKCSSCEEEHIACLDFHHINSKEYNIADMINKGSSKKNILKEVSKCIIICSNCHRKLHYKEREVRISEG